MSRRTPPNTRLRLYATRLTLRTNRLEPGTPGTSPPQLALRRPGHIGAPPAPAPAQAAVATLGGLEVRLLGSSRLCLCNSCCSCSWPLLGLLPEEFRFRRLEHLACESRRDKSNQRRRPRTKRKVLIEGAGEEEARGRPACLPHWLSLRLLFADGCNGGRDCLVKRSVDGWMDRSTLPSLRSSPSPTAYPVH